MALVRSESVVEGEAGDAGSVEDDVIMKHEDVTRGSCASWYSWCVECSVEAGRSEATLMVQRL